MQNTLISPAEKYNKINNMQTIVAQVNTITTISNLPDSHTPENNEVCYETV
jgi:hypothetical protein